MPALNPTIKWLEDLQNLDLSFDNYEERYKQLLETKPKDMSLDLLSWLFYHKINGLFSGQEFKMLMKIHHINFEVIRKEKESVEELFDDGPDKD